MGLFWNKPKVEEAAAVTSPTNTPIDVSGYPIDTFRLTVSDVFKLSDGTKMLSGKVDSGSIAIGDIVLINGQVTQIIQLENFTRRTPPVREPAPLAATILTELGVLLMSDIQRTVYRLEQIYARSGNTTADANASEAVALNVSLGPNVEVPKGTMIYKLSASSATDSSGAPQNTSGPDTTV